MVSGDHKPPSVRNPSDMQKQFDESFRALLKTGEPTKQIKGLLSRYCMSRDLEIAEVVSEVYIRAIKSLNAGNPIRNLPAWFRTTSRNVIFEQIKAKERQNRLRDQLTSTEQAPDCNAEEHQVAELFAILEQLDPLDRKILLWVAEGISYERIAEQLVLDGSFQDSPSLIATLRKRVSRAREKLRQHRQKDC